MGRVQVTARIENREDLYRVDQGIIPFEGIRAIEVTDALVDTGAKMLSMPSRLIQELGLRPLSFRIFGTVRLTIQGRDCPSDVTEVPDDCPVLIGQVPLELMDFVNDPRGRRLIGNPEHGGEHILDMY